MSSSAALCQAAESVLVLIDIQERLAGAMPAQDLAAFVQRASLLAQAASLLDIPILATEQYPQGLGETLQPIRRQMPDTVSCMAKTGFSCCAADGFGRALQALGRGQVILAGMESHVCVLQTALELQAQRFTVFVPGDAVCARSRQRTAGALARLTQAGVIVSHSESVLFEWLRDARHPRFKAISRLLKDAGP